MKTSNPALSVRLFEKHPSASAGEEMKVFIIGDLEVEGAKSFVEPRPNNPTQEIAYVSLEGPEGGKSGEFDYLVQGVRKGFEDHQVIRDNTR